MNSKDIIAKREIEISVLKGQISGVEQKIKNLSVTLENLRLGLERAEKSRAKLLELAKSENL